MFRATIFGPAPDCDVFNATQSGASLCAQPCRAPLQQSPAHNAPQLILQDTLVIGVCRKLLSTQGSIYTSLSAQLSTEAAQQQFSVLCIPVLPRLKSLYMQNSGASTANWKTDQCALRDKLHDHQVSCSVLHAAHWISTSCATPAKECLDGRHIHFDVALQESMAGPCLDRETQIVELICFVLKQAEQHTMLQCCTCLLALAA